MSYFSRSLDNGAPRHLLAGIEIKNQPVRTIETVGLGSPRVDLDHIGLHQTEQPGQIVDHEHGLRFSDVNAANSITEAFPRMFGKESGLTRAQGRPQEA